MAYSTATPPVLTGLGGMDGRNKTWFYRSTDAATVVRVSGYITNGWDLGMRSGDLFIQVDTDASPITMQAMIVTSAVAGTVDLSDGTVITGTDTD